jgi:hypothetical protein
MQQRLGEERRRHLEVLLDERVIVCATDAGMPGAQVQGIVQQAFVVGADVDRYRDDPVRVDARGGGVHGQFADRDLDAADAPVADTEDLLGITAHDHVHVVGAQAEAAERRLSFLRMVDCQEDAARLPILL